MRETFKKPLVYSIDKRLRKVTFEQTVADRGSDCDTWEQYFWVQNMHYKKLDSNHQSMIFLLIKLWLWSVMYNIECYSIQNEGKIAIFELSLGVFCRKIHMIHSIQYSNRTECFHKWEGWKLWLNKFKTKSAKQVNNTAMVN